MSKGRMVILGIICALLLTGCVDVDSLDQNWFGRAHNDIYGSIDKSWFNWVYLMAIPCMIFAAKALLREEESDWVGALHWFLIMIFGVGSFFRFIDVINIAGQEFWPSGYTISSVMDWMGWEIPFPSDAVWTSPFAYIVTDLFPSVFNIWQWTLLILHGGMIFMVAMSRNTKPIVVDLAFVLSWAITPVAMAIVTFGAASAKGDAAGSVTKALIEVVYVFAGAGVIVAFFLLVPCAVGILAIFVPWGKFEYSWAGKDREKKALLVRAIDRGGMLGLLGGLLVDVQPPLRGNRGNNQRAVVSDSSQLPPPGAVEGKFRDMGPDDFGPVSPRAPEKPSTPSGTATPEEGFPEVKTAAKSVREGGDLDQDTFEPRTDKLQLKAGSSRFGEEKKFGDDEFPDKKRSLTKGLGAVGRVAKDVAPLVTAVRPEAGIALNAVGAAGELLDRDDVFPSSVQKVPSAKVPSLVSEPVAEEEEKDDMFPSSSVKHALSKKDVKPASSSSSKSRGERGIEDDEFLHPKIKRLKGDEI